MDLHSDKEVACLAGERSVGQGRFSEGICRYEHGVVSLVTISGCGRWEVLTCGVRVRQTQAVKLALNLCTGLC